MSNHISFEKDEIGRKSMVKSSSVTLKGVSFFGMSTCKAAVTPVHLLPPRDFCVVT